MIRTTLCKTLRCGGAAVWTAVLKQLFLVERVSEVGISLVIRGRHVNLFLIMGTFLLDGDAVRMMFGSKGARGKLPCIGCLNVSTDPALEGDGMVSVQSFDVDAFVRATDEDLWAKADALETASRGPATARKKLETALGLNYAPEAFLWCKPLRRFVRPSECLTFDQVHILLTQGLADDEYERILPRLERAGITWDHMDRFVHADWRSAKCFSQSAKLAEVFGAARRLHWRSTKSFSLSASTHLAVMPICLHFLETIVDKLAPGRLTKEINSFRCLVAVVSLVKEGKTKRCDADQLQRACVAHAKAFLRAYPDDIKLSVKQHWLFHLAWQLLRDGFVLDCYVGERGHAAIKACALTLGNTDIFEASLLRRMFAHTVACLRDLETLWGHLLKPKPSVFFGGPVAKAMMFGGTLYARDDVVLACNEVFVISCFMFVGGEFHMVASQLITEEEVTPSSYRCLRSEDSQSMPLAGMTLRFAASWYWSDERHALVIIA